VTVQLGASLLCAAAVLAQAGIVQPHKPLLRSSVEVTVVTATVRDGNGKLVTGLPREAFEIYEDGVRVPIAQFTNERVPLGLGLLLDTSDSMFGRKLKDAGGAVERFLLNQLAPTDAFFLIAFNHAPHVLFGWKTSPDGVHSSLDRLHPSGATAIYDAILAAIPFIDHRPRERAAIVLITDGANNTGQPTPLVAAEAARTLGVRVQAIGLSTRDTASVPLNGVWRVGSTAPRLTSRDEIALRRIAERTGGRYYRATDPEALSGIMQQIDQAERVDVVVGETRDYRELYPILLGPALLLLIVELGLGASWLRTLP
jgi:VWFA-related protein